MVNNGAESETTISGIPSEIKEFKMYVTNGTDGMKEYHSVSVQNGKVTFSLPEAGFTTLVNIL